MLWQAGESVSVPRAPVKPVTREVAAEPVEETGEEAKEDAAEAERAAEKLPEPTLVGVSLLPFQYLVVFRNREKFRNG